MIDRCGAIRPTTNSRSDIRRRYQFTNFRRAMYIRGCGGGTISAKYSVTCGQSCCCVSRHKTRMQRVIATWSVHYAFGSTIDYFGFA